MNKGIQIIGITGGSGSGKTFLCDNLVNHFNANDILEIKLDSYYFDLKHLKMEEREKNNFDHPSSFDFNLLYKHLKQIQEGLITNIPVYDYTTHTRKSEYQIINKEYCLILVEGILSLYNEQIRNMMSFSVYIDIPNNIRKKRRLKRDLAQRERTAESISLQYTNTVEPMYTKYIKPTKKFSDVVIKEINYKDIGYIQLLDKINTILNNEK